MNDIIYEGERLIFGQIGHFLILLSFVSALLSAVAYFMSMKSDNAYHTNYRKIGQGSFIVHGISILGIFGLIIYLLTQRAYEYFYVWQHVSDDLSLRYVLSSFWEGQEGSFLLWMFWHVILGFLVMAWEKKYQAPVIGTISAVQVIIGSMLLGLYIWNGAEPVRVGINPFVLLRNEMDAPIFASVDYLANITGSGLNPLLQNYWMTIHPPVLFLGFGATVIPFGYAIAGLLTKDHKPFLSKVLPWSLFAAGSLGTGIFLGGLWAYEALSFGGYWAWDPVENMSLVPWLILVAGIHTNLIARATGQSIKSTYVYYLLTFVLIVYSTFLTRSGVLGDTSVHAFTEMGLEWQLLFFLFVPFLVGFGLFANRYKTIPTVEKEEATSSREFWMFLGALTLVFSAVLISFTTSIPVFNKLFDAYGLIVGKDMTHMHRSSPLDPVAHYNKYQMWIAVFIGILSAVAILLRYKRPLSGESFKKFGINFGIAAIVAGAIHAATYDLMSIKAWQYHLVYYSGLLTILTNLSYIVNYVRFNTRASASAVSHIGFGLLIVGIMASGLNKQYISTNPFAQRGLIDDQSEESLKKNITLLKGVPMLMSGYEVEYVSDSLAGIIRTYDINFKRRNEDGEVIESFNLHPNILYDRDMTKIAASNPSTKHYLGRDIFTHIHALPPEEVDLESARAKEDSLKYEDYPTALLDTFVTTERYGYIANWGLMTENPNYTPRENEYVIGASIAFKELKSDKVHWAYPFVAMRDGIVLEVPYQVNSLNLKAKIDGDLANRLFLPSREDYTERFEVSLGESFEFMGYTLRINKFQQKARHPFYDSEPGDVSVGADISIYDESGEHIDNVFPVFIIRDNQSFRVLDLSQEMESLIELADINPNTERFTLNCYHKDLKNMEVPLLIAENSNRSDWLVLEAIVFPGINFVWVGSIMMLLGLFLGIYGKVRRPS